jgi:hypothetical protein
MLKAQVGAATNGGITHVLETFRNGGRAGLSSGLIRRGSRASAKGRTRPQLQVTDHADLPRTHAHKLGKRGGGTMDEVRTAPRPEAVSSALSAMSCPMRAQVLPWQRTVPGQGGEDRFAYKRAIHRGSPGLMMMRHLVSDARTGASARRCSP